MALVSWFRQARKRVWSVGIFGQFRRSGLLLVSEGLRSMPFATQGDDCDWRSRIDKRFTSLRGAAALIVMLAHYQYLGFLPGVPVFKYSGQCGLMVFFFLSSFLLAHSLATDPNWAARPHLSVLTYSINRIFRIFLLLCAVIGLTCWNGSSFFPPSTPFWEGLRLSATLGRARKFMDDSGRTDVLRLPALHPGPGPAGDAIASRRRGSGVGLPRVVHRQSLWRGMRAPRPLRG